MAASRAGQPVAATADEIDEIRVDDGDHLTATRARRESRLLAAGEPGGEV